MIRFAQPSAGPPAARADDGPRFDVASAAIRGAREHQEDCLVTSFAVGQRHGFVVLADGMGGHAAGNVASALAAGETFAHLRMHDAALEQGSPDLPAILREAADRANARIAAHAAAQAGLRGMGTTLLAPVFHGNRLWWLSVGDSPLLLLRDGALYRLNKIHSMAAQIDLLVKAGQISAEEGRAHPDRNSLTSALTGGEISRIDCPAASETLRPGDIVVIASDGLLALANATIAGILLEARESDAAQIAGALLAALRALGDPEQDNATLAVVKLRPRHRRDAARSDAAPSRGPAAGATARPSAAGRGGDRSSLIARGTAHLREVWERRQPAPDGAPLGRDG